jgi:molecular chaperone GrpE
MGKKETTDQAQAAELTQDLQRLRADFENYRKRVDAEKQSARDAASASMVIKLLPVVDTIDRAVTHMPPELESNNWAQGIANLTKQLEKVLSDVGVERIAAAPGTPFDPHLHEAVMMDETEGDQEVVAEELQAGYLLNGVVARHSMVRVTRQ